MQTENFKFAVAHTLEAEGLFTIDTGGKTMFGITEAVWSMYGDQLTPIEQISKEQAIEVYHKQYWSALRLDEIANKYIAAEIFDSAVNCGRIKAAYFAQAAYNYICNNQSVLTEDGVFGPVTRSTINQAISKGYTIPLLLAMNGEQYIHYKTLVKNGDKYDKYARGWTKRLKLLQD